MLFFRLNFIFRIHMIWCNKCHSFIYRKISMNHKRSFLKMNIHELCFFSYFAVKIRCI